MSVPVIGIDLGTTNSVVAYADESGTVTVIADENGDRIIPSVVHFEWTETSSSAATHGNT
jgi:molecular chaperone DnaK (HSP70)